MENSLKEFKSWCEMAERIREPEETQLKLSGLRNRMTKELSKMNRSSEICGNPSSISK